MIVARRVTFILIRADRMTLLRLPRTAAAITILALSGGALSGAALAQIPSGDTVAWTVSTSTDAIKPGGRLTVTLHGAVLDGWHVYGLKQLPEGPTPLTVTVDPDAETLLPPPPAIASEPVNAFRDPTPATVDAAIAPGVTFLIVPDAWSNIGMKSSVAFGDTRFVRP